MYNFYLNSSAGMAIGSCRAGSANIDTYTREVSKWHTARVQNLNCGKDVEKSSLKTDIVTEVLNAVGGGNAYKSGNFGQ